MSDSGDARREVAALRRALAAAAEHILAALDVLDGDPDLEPSLGSLENDQWIFTWGTVRGRIGDQTDWTGGGTADLEEGHDGAEPSLGAAHDKNQHRAWSRFDAGDDRELEHDGREPDAGREPSLGFLEPDPRICRGIATLPAGRQLWSGWRDGLDQRWIAQGSTTDAEGPDDNGIGDRDGAEQQWSSRLSRSD